MEFPIIGISFKHIIKKRGRVFSGITNVRILYISVLNQSDIYGTFIISTWILSFFSHFGWLLFILVMTWPGFSCGVGVLFVICNLRVDLRF